MENKEAYITLTRDDVNKYLQELNNLKTECKVKKMPLVRRLKELSKVDENNAKKVHEFLKANDLEGLYRSTLFYNIKVPEKVIEMKPLFGIFPRNPIRVPAYTQKTQRDFNFLDFSDFVTDLLHERFEDMNFNLMQCPLYMYKNLRHKCTKDFWTLESYDLEYTEYGLDRRHTAVIVYHRRLEYTELNKTCEDLTNRFNQFGALIDKMDKWVSTMVQDTMMVDVDTLSEIQDMIRTTKKYFLQF